MVDEGDYFFMADHVAALGSGYTALYACNEFGALLQHSSDDILRRLRGGLALAGGQLLKLGFGIGANCFQRMF